MEKNVEDSVGYMVELQGKLKEVAFNLKTKDLNLENEISDKLTVLKRKNTILKRKQTFCNIKEIRAESLINDLQEKIEKKAQRSLSIFKTLLSKEDFPIPIKEESILSEISSISQEVSKNDEEDLLINEKLQNIRGILNTNKLNEENESEEEEEEEERRISEEIVNIKADLKEKAFKIAFHNHLFKTITANIQEALSNLKEGFITKDRVLSEEGPFIEIGKLLLELDIKEKGFKPAFFKRFLY